MGNGTVAYKHNADLRRQHNKMKRRYRREDNCRMHDGTMRGVNRMHGNVNGREGNCRMHDGTTSGTRGVNRMHGNARGRSANLNHNPRNREPSANTSSIRRPPLQRPFERDGRNGSAARRSHDARNGDFAHTHHDAHGMRHQYDDRPYVDPSCDIPNRMGPTYDAHHHMERGSHPNNRMFNDSHSSERLSAQPYGGANEAFLRSPYNERSSRRLSRYDYAGGRALHHPSDYRPDCDERPFNPVFNDRNPFSGQRIPHPQRPNVGMSDEQAIENRHLTALLHETRDELHILAGAVHNRNMRRSADQRRLDYEYDGHTPAKRHRDVNYHGNYRG